MQRNPDVATGHQQPDSGLRRVLGRFDATSVVIGAIIGVGIFFNPTQVAQAAGSAAMALGAWAVGGAIALCGALTFAQLGAAYPRAGGQYELLRDAYGPFPAFLFVFCNATAIQTGSIAIISLVCAQNLSVALTGNELAGASHVVVAAALIVGVTLANLLGVRWGSLLQNVTVGAKLAAIAGIILLAIATASRVPPPPPIAASRAPAGAASIGLLFAAVVPCFFAYGGWQQALWVGGEIRDAKKNLPLAIIVGVLVVLAVYLAVNWAYLHLLGYDGVVRSRALATDAVAAVWPLTGARIAAAAVAISALGVLNAQLLTGPRLVYRMAQDGWFFSPFARVSAVTRVPVAAIVLLGGFGLLLLLGAYAGSDDAPHAIDALTTGVVFIDGIFFALSGASVFILKRRASRAAPESAAAADFRASHRLGYPFVPAAFVLGELAILISAGLNSNRQGAIGGAAWVAAASLVFLLFAVRRRRPA